MAAMLPPEFVPCRAIDRVTIRIGDTANCAVTQNAGLRMLFSLPNRKGQLIRTPGRSGRQTMNGPTDRKAFCDRMAGHCVKHEQRAYHSCHLGEDDLGGAGHTYDSDNRREIEAEDLPNQTAPLPGSLAQEPHTYARLIPTWRSDYEA
jgi:hypothetical protein